MKRQRSKKTKPDIRAKRGSSQILTQQTGIIWAAGVLLVVMTVAAYVPAMQCGYIWDDDFYVQNNQTLRSADGLRRIWFEIGSTPQYYPVVHTSYWLEYRLWELDPTGYHVVNILLHALGAVLLWRVLSVLAVPGAWVAAAVFAVHPVQVESVAWITERKNVLSGVFYLSAALAYLRFALVPQRGSGHDRTTRLYVASLALFLCALLSKTVTCTLPAVLLILLWWKGKRVGWTDLRGLAPFFLIAIALGLLTVWMEKYHVGAEGEEWNLSLIERSMLAGRVLCFYAGKLLWPSQLTFIYPRWQMDAHVWWQYLYSTSALAVVAALWVARNRIGRGPLVAVLFFAGTLVPALGFFDVYPMRYSFVADHFQYLACVGPITLIASIGYRTADRLGGSGKRGATIVLACVLVTLGALSWRQQRVYNNLETLWRDTIAKNPGAWMAHTNLGTVLRSQGKFDEAISHYRQTLKLEPDCIEAHFNLGNVLRSQGRLDEAIRQYRQTLQIEPDHAEAHNNLGNALKSQGKLDEAIRHYGNALRLKPNHAKAYFNLGNVLKSQGRLDEAIDRYRQALRHKPSYPEAHNNLANTLQSQGKFTDAIRHYRLALKLRPNHAGTHFGLGLTLEKIGHRDAALEHFREAARLKPDWPAPRVRANRMLQQVAP